MARNGTIGGSAAAFAALLAAAYAPAEAQTSAAGQLRCDVSGGMTILFASSRDLECEFRPNNGPSEFYNGRITKYGVDLGRVRSGTIYWAVVSPALTRGPGKLAGKYYGASAQASLGAGITANALVGGNKIVLNPLSIGEVTGINIAAGITGLVLTPVDIDPDPEAEQFSDRGASFRNDEDRPTDTRSEEEKDEDRLRPLPED